MKKLLLCLMWLTVIECFYTPKQQQATRAQVRQILSMYEELYGRQPGDASVFTETMVFNIKTEHGEEIKLVLKLNNDTDVNMITEIMVSEDEFGDFDDFNNEGKKDYRFYQNVEDGAAIKVTCPNFQKPCHINGMFVKDYIPYEIHNDIAVDISDEFDHALFDYPDFDDIDRSRDTVKIKLDESEMKRVLEQDIDNLLNYLDSDKDMNIDSRTTFKNYKIEMHFVVVYDVYDKYFQKYKDRDTALKAITEFIEQTGNEMDMIFALSYDNQYKYNYRFDLVPYKLTILESKAASQWFANHVTEEGNNKLSFNGDGALDSFNTWAKTHKDKKADAIMYFTGADMISGGTRGTIGLAYSVDNQNLVCKHSGTIAVASVEIVGALTGTTAAHELVHNFGVNHDGVKGVSCPDEDYLMAASNHLPKQWRAQNPFKLSSCSMQTIDNNLRTTLTNSEGKTCLEVHSYNETKYKDILNGPLLGKQYSARTQCQMRHGTKADVALFSDVPMKQEDICWKGLPCKISSTYFYSLRYERPHLGTPCGTNKMCKLGKCVEDTSASKTTTPPKELTTPFKWTTAPPKKTTTPFKWITAMDPVKYPTVSI